MCEHHTLPDLRLHFLGYDSPHIFGEVLLLLLSLLLFLLLSSLAVIVIELPRTPFRRTVPEINIP